MGEKFTNKEIDKIIDNIAGSFAMENLICTEEEKEIGRKILRGEISAENAIELLL